jgi:adenylate cyclase
MVQNPDQLRGDEARLWRLIECRRQQSVDKAKIDECIWDVFGQHWAIMFTDLAGFSRFVADAGIIDFLGVIHDSRQLLLPVIEEHAGVLILAEADSFLILFKRARKAMLCAVAMQQACIKANHSRPAKHHIRLCVGIGYGEILRIGSHNIYGGEVNASSKLGEDSAKSGDIFVTGEARKAAGIDLSYEKLDLDVPGSDECFRLNYKDRASD